ncbi:twin-arginine translocation signal domain-containing protein [Pannonibacter sp. Pt2-lr]
MKRRDFLKTGALAAAAAPALAAPALAQATLNLKLVGGFPRGFPVWAPGPKSLPSALRR